MKGDRTPVVTGVGLVTPAGTTRGGSWGRIRDGDRCLAPPGRVDRELAERYSVRVTGEIDEFDADHPRIDDRTMGRYTALAVDATYQALDDAGLVPEEWDDDRVGVSVASAFGGLESIFDSYDDRTKASPYLATRSLVNLAAGHISIVTGARGPNRAPATACAAGTHAVDVGVTDLLRDRGDVMLVGGTESVIHHYGVAMTASPRAYTTREGSDAVRPFDADRDGLALGEGAAILVLEAREHARQRGVDPYARVAGIGASADGHHPVRPPEDGAGLRRAMEMALDEAGVRSVDFVNAHGTATEVGDRAEVRAVERVVGTDTPITSVKGSIGHTYGAAGAIDAATSVLAIRDGVVPATANVETPDPEFDVPVVSEPRETDVERVISNSAGFGGTNGAVVFEK